MSLAGNVVSSWSLTEEVAGLSPFSDKYFVTEFNENIRKNSIKIRCLTLKASKSKILRNLIP